MMERTNHVLVKETPSEIMIPMVYGWLQPVSKEASVVNAGHEPFFICRADGRIEDIPPTGLVLGLMETPYAEVRVRFEPGDLMFACSDGITAAAVRGELRRGPSQRIGAKPRRPDRVHARPARPRRRTPLLRHRQGRHVPPRPQAHRMLYRK